MCTITHNTTLIGTHDELSLFDETFARTDEASALEKVESAWISDTEIAYSFTSSNGVAYPTMEWIAKYPLKSITRYASEDGSVSGMVYAENKQYAIRETRLPAKKAS